MKKLVIAAVAVAMAVVANAASVKWSCPYGIADGTESGATSAPVVYLINAADVAQNDIYTALVGGAALADVVAGKTVASAALDEGGMSVQDLTLSYAANSKQTMYMVCFDEGLNAVYFSEAMEKTISGTGATKYQFGADTSMESVMADMSGFSAADGGWVSTAAVPEPTSGLLLLLGMAGLALKRKQA